ncbi:MAG: helix-turn-helix domain-containing protein [Mycobacterium sp.]
MPPRRADAVRNRDRLVAAAAEVFGTRGVDAPLEDIARHAGVSIGTLYNHFPNRGALLDAALPDWGAMIDRLAEAALADADPWRGFADFMVAMFEVQARDRAINDAIARRPVGSVDVASECGRTGSGLHAVLERAHREGVVRNDFCADDLAVLVAAMAQVIAHADGDDMRWRRHLAFVLDGIHS